MSGALRRLAATAPPSVFAVAGLDARDAVQDLQLDPSIRLVVAPRQANVLLLAGRLTEPLLTAAVSAHDVMPAPRCAIEWQLRDTSSTTAAISGTRVITDLDPVPSIVSEHLELLGGQRPSSPAIREDAAPAPWRGVGPYGQGGSGMTGGVPYGRPMAEREDDRDVLTLDALPIQVGPLFSGFPQGLAARVTFQGDLVQRFELGANPFAGWLTSGFAEPFLQALTEPVRVVDLEVARARRLLRWTADALRIHGLHALSLRVLGLAARVGPGDAAVVRRLGRWIIRAVTGRQTRDVGIIPRARLEGFGLGPVARAAGLPYDVRTDDPVYRELAFRPVTGARGDARDRWRQRLAEAEQALDLAARADDRRAGGTGVIESPRGRLEPGSSPTQRLLELVPDLVTGLEWGDAVTTLTSLDLDLREAAALAHEETSAVP